MLNLSVVGFIFLTGLFSSTSGGRIFIPQTSIIKRQADQNPQTFTLFPNQQTAVVLPQNTQQLNPMFTNIPSIPQPINQNPGQTDTLTSSLAIRRPNLPGPMPSFNQPAIQQPNSFVPPPASFGISQMIPSSPPIPGPSVLPRFPSQSVSPPVSFQNSPPLPPISPPMPQASVLFPSPSFPVPQPQPLPPAVLLPSFSNPMQNTQPSFPNVQPAFPAQAFPPPVPVPLPAPLPPSPIPQLPPPLPNPQPADPADSEFDNLIRRATFSCKDKITGFYVNINLGCKIWHYCLSGTRYDHMCPPETLFSQEFLTCTFAKSVDCANSARFYERNNNLFLTQGSEIVENNI